MVQKCPVQHRVIQEGVFRYGNLAHRARAHENLLYPLADFIGGHADCDGPGHGAAHAGPAHDVDGDAQIDHRLVDAHMRHAKGPAA